MNDKRFIGVILLFITLIVVFILIFLSSDRYNKYVVDNNEWDSIVNNKELSTNISLKKIEFNDYSLLIDNDNSIIYYSLIDSKKKYNPSIKYSLNEKVNIAINDVITSKKIESKKDLRILLYNDKNYRIYTLVVTKYPILNIKYNEKLSGRSKIAMNLELFDNRKNSSKRVIKSSGYLKIHSKNSEYRLSLKKESLGHNQRDNNISIFDMKKANKYIIKKDDNMSENNVYVKLFINNKYNDIFLFKPKN